MRPSGWEAGLHGVSSGVRHPVQPLDPAIRLGTNVIDMIQRNERTGRKYTRHCRSDPFSRNPAVTTAFPAPVPLRNGKENVRLLIQYTHLSEVLSGMGYSGHLRTAVPAD